MQEDNNLPQNPPLQQTAVSGSFLFDKSLLEKVAIKQPEYVMGVDICYIQLFFQLFSNIVFFY